MNMYGRGLRSGIFARATTETAVRRGHVLAAALAGAWRPRPPKLTIPPTVLQEIAPFLIISGTAGLVWRRLDMERRPSCDAVVSLRHAYRYERLQDAVRERQTMQAFALLRGAGVEPLLAKGAAVARLYPERGLRPYGDIDLYVRPEQYDAAVAAIAAEWVGPVDLHRGIATLNDRSIDEIYARSQMIRLSDGEVRVLGPEDQLRHLCVHLLRHAAHRPLWLCDVAAVLESLPESFDIQYLFRGTTRRAHWLACVLQLAHQLLGAQIDDRRLLGNAQDLPAWLIPAVFRQWQVGRGHFGSPPTAFFLRNPAGLVKALRRRWPNPIQATVNLGGSFNNVSRLPFQIGECAIRTARFVAARTWRH
jgi:hypothetical protein